MPPIDLLGILLLITAAAVGVERWQRGRSHCIYRQLALQHGMHYSPRDPLRLTPRIAGLLPVVGAAGVRVIDLMYRTDDQTHYYVFTAEYTVGVVGSKKRVRRVACCTESKSGAGIVPPVKFGIPGLSLVEQYQAMIAG